MKKSKIVIVFLLVVLVMLTGCKRKEKINIKNYELKKGTVTSVCTRKDSYEGIDTETVTTTNFDENHYIMNMKILYTETIKDEDEFKYRASELKENAKRYENSDTMIFSYGIDDKKNITVTETAFPTLDLSAMTDSEKQSYVAKNYIKNSEDGGATCEVYGITKKELGL